MKGSNNSGIISPRGKDRPTSIKSIMMSRSTITSLKSCQATQSIITSKTIPISIKSGIEPM